jgi:hypothetical protein
MLATAIALLSLSWLSIQEQGYLFFCAVGQYESNPPEALLQ